MARVWNAILAQSAEQTLRKRQVLGSIPRDGFTPGPADNTGLFFYKVKSDAGATDNRKSLELAGRGSTRS